MQNCGEKLTEITVKYIESSYCIPCTKYVWGILWFSRRYASAFHRLRDNLKNPYQIASIFDIGERIAGKQDGPGPIIYGPPRAPRIAKNAHFCILCPIYEKLSVIFSLVIHMFALWWGLTALKFSFTWVWRKGPPRIPQIWKKMYILGLNLKISYQIVSLFAIYIDIGERIAGEQDRQI